MIVFIITLYEYFQEVELDEEWAARAKIVSIYKKIFLIRKIDYLTKLLRAALIFVTFLLVL